jgi:NDP-sugar pyrophosphorylase family protein
MSDTLEARVRRLADESEFLRDVASVGRDGGLALALGGAPLRELFKPEIALLEALGNTARDWSRVRVADGFNPRRVRNCELSGDIVFGRFNEYVPLADGVEVVAGVSNSALCDCVIGHNAVVKDVRLLANYVVGEGAVVADCGRVVCSAGATFGNGRRVPVALESGGREIEVFAELDVELATLAARPLDRRAELDGYRKAVAEYRDRAAADRGVIGAGARVWSVPRLEDAYVGPAAHVDGAECVARCTILSSPDEPAVVESGSVLTDSLVQWGCRVTGMAVVESSVLVESSQVERHGKVTNSVIGPNTAIGAGEVSSCVLGPFVGVHHQSLLISTLWPGGRGNVGYGGNVGSNHTSRAPDQELWAGEGVFFGLGVSVQFPCDLSRSPYTVIAFGADLPPQKVAFPFSLIAAGRGDYHGHNGISPGWMLSDNIYALRRNEAKYKARDRAKRSTFDFRVFRRDTVELMRDAAGRLAAAGGKETYTEKDIPGLGRNVLSEADRVKGLEAYRFYAAYYALGGLRDRVRELLAAGSADAARVLVTPAPEQPEWEYQRQLLLADVELTDPAEGLRQFAGMTLQIAKDCERAREKDDNRGRRVIDDYADVHPAADRDAVVRAAWDEADRVRDEVEALIAGLFPAGVTRAEEARV